MIPKPIDTSSIDQFFITAKHNSTYIKKHTKFRCPILPQTGFNSAVNFTDEHPENKK